MNPAARALVIQGQLHSPPRHDNPLADLERAGTRVEYSAYRSILDTIERNSIAADNVVIVTWDHPDNVDIARRLQAEAGVRILCIADPGVPPVGKRPARDNRYRQVVGSLAGLQLLRDGGFDGLVARTRPDQLVDVDGMLDAVDATRAAFTGYRESGQKAFIHVPCFARRAYLAADFYFAGHIDDLLAFFAAQRDHASLYVGTDTLHAEFLKKHLMANLAGFLAVSAEQVRRELPETPAANRVPIRWRYPEQYLEPYYWMLRHSVAPLPRSNFTGLIWRGLPYESGWSSDVPRIFLEEWMEHYAALERYLYRFSGGDNWFRPRQPNWLDRLASVPRPPGWRDDLLRPPRQLVAAWRERRLVRTIIGEKHFARLKGAVLALLRPFRAARH